MASCTQERGAVFDVLRRFGVRRKLVLLVMLTNGVSVSFACVAFSLTEWFYNRREMAADLDFLSRIVAAGCVGSLRDDDSLAAERVLMELENEPRVAAARIYTREGAAFATYERGVGGRDSTPAVRDGGTSENGRVFLSKPIQIDGETIGSVLLNANSGNLHQRLGRYASITGVILLLTCLVTYMLSGLLQRFILRPIRHLSQTASRVALGRDYSIRATKEGDDELGVLTDSFNQILEQIQIHDAELHQELAERKRAEATLKLLAVKLHRKNKELQDFANVASHDLREPLRKIIVFGDRLRAKCMDALGEQGRDYLERMQNAAGRMQTLIDGLLAFSQVTTNAQPFKTVHLKRIIEETLGDLEHRVEGTGARVEVCEFPEIEADPVQMRQLFQNLIGNALKYRRPDEPPIIKIGAEWASHPGQQPNEASSTNGHVQITVEDNGIGFDEKYTERIFRIFQRLHGRDRYEGTGIGLAICRRIVERHGGTITAMSVPGKGSSLVVVLPLHQATGRRQP